MVSKFSGLFSLNDCFSKIASVASLDEAEFGIELGFERSSGFGSLVIRNWCSFDNAHLGSKIIGQQLGLVS